MIFLRRRGFLGLCSSFRGCGFGRHRDGLGFPATFFGAAFAVLTAFLAVDFAAAAINFLAVAEVRPAAMSFFILAFAN